MRACLAALLLIFSSIGFSACGERPQDEASALELPLPLEETVIYELYVRSFTEEGTFQAIIPRLDELRDLGVTTIWLMPIHPVGEIARKGTLGSPYSITDYRAVNPEFGTHDDFRVLVNAIHDRGMYVILDFVANHTAWDHAWVTEHAEWYTQVDDEIIHPEGTDWTDVADLNYDNQDLRAAMLADLRYWIEEFGIDGYRMDVAELVPMDFWEDAIAELRTIKPILMLAEGHIAELHDVGFDLTYSWDSYHASKLVWQGAPADTLNTIIQRELDSWPPNGRMRFSTNHDETAWDASPLTLFNGVAGTQAAAVIAATIPGVLLIYNGQEIGDDQMLPLFEKVPINWDANPDMRAFYIDLLERRNSYPALRSGSYEFVEHEAQSDVFVFRRSLGEDVVTVAINVRDRAIEFELPELGRAEIEPYGWVIIPRL